VVIPRAPVVISRSPVVIPRPPVVIPQPPAVVTQSPVLIPRSPAVVARRPLVIPASLTLVSVALGLVAREQGEFQSCERRVQSPEAFNFGVSAFMDQQAKSYSGRSVDFAAVILLLSISLLQVTLVMLIVYSLIPTAKIDWFRTWENWEHATAALEHVTTVAALILGGVFAYYKFFKRRLFFPRLDLRLSARCIRRDQATYLIARLALKNVGSTRVDIRQVGTALRIWYADDVPITRPAEVAWNHIRSFSIFKRHRGVESGEPIQDELMMIVPGNEHLAFKLEFRLVPEVIFNNERITFRTVTIIEQNAKGSSATSPERESECDIQKRRDDNER
jgi:hypothetical protein